MTLLISEAHQGQICRHGEAHYPEECCGVLLGRVESATNRCWVEQVQPLVNTWTPEVGIRLGQSLDPGRDRRSRYWVDPQDLLQVQRQARDLGWVIVGIYHSHPDHPAEPSECDRTLAWEGYSYPIVAVYQGQAQDFRSWRLDGAGQFQREAIAAPPPQESRGAIALEPRDSGP